MSYAIAYGNEKIPFHIPSGHRVTELCLPVVEPTKVVPDIINAALDKPIGTRQIEQIVKPGQRICIISDDVTRPTPVGSILDHLIPRLIKSGAKLEDMVIMIALGSHRRMTEAEITNKLGDHAQSIRILQSSYEDDQFVSVGKTTSGNDIWLAKTAMEADIRIGIGNIVPHNTLGFSGGGKILFPGIANERSVSEFHAHAASFAGGVFGQIENEVRDEVERWVDDAGLSFIINTVLNREGQLVACVAGDFRAAHRAGVKRAYDIYAVPFTEKADIVVVDGEPSSFDFWQGTKGLNAASIVVKPGGSVILSCPCTEGVGPHDEYLDALGGRNVNDTGDPLAVSVGQMMHQLTQYYDTYMYSNGMKNEQLQRANIKKIGDISLCVQQLLQRYGPEATICLIHDGAELLPIWQI